MPYTIYKTNGAQLTTIEDGKLNLATDLQLVGKNYAGYGQIVNDNLVKLLENFANGTAPSKSLTGQIWYDTLNKKLKVYNGTKWNQVLPTTISSIRPVDLADNEFWFDSVNFKLYLKHNDTFRLIGSDTVTSGSGGSGSTLTTTEVISDTLVAYNIIKLKIGEATVAIISDQTFDVGTTDPTYAEVSKIFKGITLIGADPLTGISSESESFFWGTAADSEKLAGRPSTDFLLSSEINNIASGITELTDITVISSGSPSTPGIIEGAWSLSSGSTLTATYADLAERYEADAVYEPGTVLILGGEKEVTISRSLGDTAVAGVVSTAPAFKMNSAAGDDNTHPYIALAGRIPCKVVGQIKKGDLLITSNTPGVAISGKKQANPNCVIGRAMQDYSSNEIGLIEIKV
jgi:hypothetical protein